MIWILYEPLNLFFMLLCILTNPIVVLFSSKEGELPGILHYWQTWDDSLNPRFYILDHVPKCLRYDYDKHFEEYWGQTDKLKQLNKQRCFARVKDGNFTFKEKIQLYITRVMWLYRNISYGFSFYVLGRMFNSAKMTLVKEKKHDDGSTTRVWADTSKSMLTRPWCIKSDARISKHLRVKIYMGWKIDNSSLDLNCQHMIAHCIVPRYVK